MHNQCSAKPYFDNDNSLSGDDLLKVWFLNPSSDFRPDVLELDDIFDELSRTASNDLRDGNFVDDAALKVCRGQSKDLRAKKVSIGT